MHVGDKAPGNGAKLANPIRKAGEGPSPLPKPSQGLWLALGVKLHPYPLLSSAPSSRFVCQHRHLLQLSKPSRSISLRRALPPLAPRAGQWARAPCASIKRVGCVELWCHPLCRDGLAAVVRVDAYSVGVSGVGGCSGSCAQGWEGGCGDRGCCWGRCLQAAVLGGQRRQPGSSSRQSCLSGAPAGTQRALFCARLSSVARWGLRGSPAGLGLGLAVCVLYPLPHAAWWPSWRSKATTCEGR